MKNVNGESELEFLENYKNFEKDKYEKPSVTVDMLLFTVRERQGDKRRLPEKNLSLLLVKRKDHPFIGKWAIPGGFVNVNESLESAAARELKEETNVENVYMEQLYTWGDVERDPRMRVISTSYMALVDSSKINAIAGDDAAECKWFNIKRKVLERVEKTISDIVTVSETTRIELQSDETMDESIYAIIETTQVTEGCVERKEFHIKECKNIAFDHAKIIMYGVERLMNKLEYTSIAFNLLPKRFTLSELQNVYEIVLGKELIKANFRRKISPMVVETEEYKKEAQFRPAKLFKFNTAWRSGF